MKIQQELQPEGKHTLVPGVIDVGKLSVQCIFSLAHQHKHKLVKYKKSGRTQFHGTELSHLLDALTVDKTYIIYGWTCGSTPAGHYIALKHGCLFTDRLQECATHNIKPFTVSNLQRMLYFKSTIVRVYEVVPL